MRAVRARAQRADARATRDVTAALAARRAASAARPRARRRPAALRRGHAARPGPHAAGRHGLPRYVLRPTRICTSIE